MSRATFKSLILDIANNYGNSSYLSLRSIDLYKDGIKTTIASSDIQYVNATSYLNLVNYSPEYVFLTSISKTGSSKQKEWFTDTGETTNQRLLVVFVDMQSADEIVVNNGHDGVDSSSLSRGIKDTIITISPDTITSTTYNAVISNGTVIFDGEIPQHIGQDVADPYVVLLQGGDPPAITAPIRALLANLSTSSITTRSLVTQSLSSLSNIRTGITQIAKNCDIIRKKMVQKNGCATAYRAVLNQYAGCLDAMRSRLVQKLAISSGTVRTSVKQSTDLQRLNRLRAQVTQLMSLSAGAAIIKRHDFAIEANTNGLIRQLTSYSTISDETDEDQYYIDGEIQLEDVAEFNSCQKLITRITVRDGDDAMEFVVVDKKTNRYETYNQYVLSLSSPAYLLGSSESEMSTVAEATLAGTAKEVAEILCAGIDLVWDLPENPVVLYVEDRTAIDCLRELTEAFGGIVQSLPDGSIHCHALHITDVDKWTETEPAITFTAQDDLFQVLPTSSPRDGYNAYLVSDSEIGSGGVTMTTDLQSSFKAHSKVWLSPFDDNAKVRGHHSSGDFVSIAGEGVTTEPITETVEFIAGEGNLTQQIYGDPVIEWKYRDLGNVKYDEDGTLTADLAENSLATVTYTTKYHLFSVISSQVASVQVYPEIYFN